MNITRAALLIALVGFTAGCQSTYDSVNDGMFSMRSRLYACAAWNDFSPNSGEVYYHGHFKQGFKDGYAAVLAGKGGCLPALPPRKYWTTHYQTPAGHEKMLTWFEGYAYGAMAADEDGIGAWSRVVAPIADPEMPIRAEPDRLFESDVESTIDYLPPAPAEQEPNPLMPTPADASLLQQPPWESESAPQETSSQERMPSF